MCSPRAGPCRVEVEKRVHGRTADEFAFAHQVRDALDRDPVQALGFPVLFRFTDVLGALSDEDVVFGVREAAGGLGVQQWPQRARPPSGFLLDLACGGVLGLLSLVMPPMGIS